MPRGQGFTIVDVYTGGIYDELRDRKDEFGPHLAALVETDPGRVELTLLFLQEGSYLSRGFQLLDFLFLLLLSALLDFSTATIAITSLRWVGKKGGVLRTLAAFALTASGTLFCACTSLLGYRVFFRGDPGFFLQILFLVPVSLALLGVGLFSFAAIWMLLSGRISKEDQEDLGVGTCPQKDIPTEQLP